MAVSNNTNQHAARRYCGLCYIEDITLPSNAFEINNNLNASNSYDVIFVIQDQGEHCNGYIVDKPKNEEQTVDLYYWHRCRICNEIELHAS